MTLSNRDKILTLTGILLALFLGALDQTIVSTALPRIVEDLDGLGRYAWVATAYLLASTVLVPIYGKLADTYSRKAIELWAVGTFLAGSFLCGLAGEFGTLPLLGDGMNQLIIFRAIQGLGGAGLFAMAFIIIADLFPPSVRGKYQGLVGAVFGVASVLGPVIGGFLTDYGSNIIPGIAGWRWVFYVNLPFGVIALWFISTRMPRLEPQGDKNRLDLVSAAFLILGLVPLILGLQLDKTSYPWFPSAAAFSDITGNLSEFVTLGSLVLAAIFLILFVVRSLHSANPILDMSLFKNRVFSTSNIALFFIGGAFLSILIFLPLFMVNVVGVSATQAGISLIPLSLGLVVGSTVAGQLVSRWGHYKYFMLGGGALLFVGAYLLSTMSADVTYGRVTIYMVICGLGLGPSFPLYTLAIQNAVDVRKLGQATSASQFFRQIGGTVGAALMGTVLATGLATAFTANTPGTATGAPPATATASSELNGGLEAIGTGVRAGFDQQFALIQKVARTGDPQALAQLTANPQLPQEFKARLQELPGLARAPKAAQDQALSNIRTQLNTQADQTVAQVTRTVKNAFADAITNIYFYAAILVVLGWLTTFFIPEVKLRTTNAPAAQAAH